MPRAYPILLDLTGRSIVIIGGGEVASRKARGVLECGVGQITVVAPVIKGGFSPMVKKIVEVYQPHHLEGADLVFAATDSAGVNDAVVRDARAHDILVNRADDGAHLPADFTVPARYSDGEAMFAVSAGSAALSASIRDELKRHWKPGWTELANVMVKLRPIIRDNMELSPEARRRILQTLASPAAVEAVMKGRQRLMDLLNREHPEIEGLPIYEISDAPSRS